jgi:hypothetical protein
LTRRERGEQDFFARGAPVLRTRKTFALHRSTEDTMQDTKLLILQGLGVAVIGLFA